MDVSAIRREYLHAGLDEREVAADPIAQFRIWFAAAVAAGLAAAPAGSVTTEATATAEAPAVTPATPETTALDPTAMTLATADAAGRPAARIVLLKGLDERGFVFYSNYESRKARDLEANPQAALVFYWPPFDRQVRVEGRIEKLTAAESAAYFASRPLASQLGAWASRQSEPIASREELERQVAAVTERFAGGAVPLPEFWGGYRVRPDRVEFWQGRPSRLHDRLVYLRAPAGAAASAGVAAPAGPTTGADAPAGADAWTIERLQP